MMTPDEISYLESPGGAAAVKDNLGRNPFTIALDKKVEQARLIASQVKYLGRARTKIPSYYQSLCIIPPVAFEQSSGEQAASMKRYAGRLCIDLTCGLGVDSLNFSRHFDKVMAVEKDGPLCRIAEINFGRLGAKNIEVINSTAEDLIRDIKEKSLKADLLYADPDRRPGSGSRRVKLEDSTPDMVTMMPELKAIARTVLVKASPLFDVGEAFRIFPECGVSVVSVEGECKEVLIECGGNNAGKISAAIAGWGEVSYPYPLPPHRSTGFAPPYSRMIIPDVALRKARIGSRYFSELFPSAYVPADGYVFLNGADLRNGETAAVKIPGKVFEVVALYPYRPKELKADLAARDIKSADIYLHDFPLPVEKICRELKLKEGGTAKFAFTRIEGELWSIELK